MCGEQKTKAILDYCTATSVRLAAPHLLDTITSQTICICSTFVPSTCLATNREGFAYLIITFPIRRFPSNYSPAHRSPLITRLREAASDCQIPGKYCSSCGRTQPGSALAKRLYHPGVIGGRDPGVPHRMRSRLDGNLIERSS